MSGRLSLPTDEDIRVSVSGFAERFSSSEELFHRMYGLEVSPVWPDILNNILFL